MTRIVWTDRAREDLSPRSAQHGTRAAGRTRCSLRVVLVTENKDVVRLPLSAERGSKPIDLSEVDAVDVSEVLHDLGVAP